MRPKKIRLMKFTLLRCTALFVSCWCGVILYAYFFFRLENQPGSIDAGSMVRASTIVKDVWQGFHELGGKRSDGISRSSIDDESHRQEHHGMTNTTLELQEDEDRIPKDIKIFLDWPEDDRLFTVDNYKALESMLNVYQDAIFRCIIATPRDAYVHKIGNMLSVTQFVKYKKRGYNIAVIPVNEKQKTRTSSIGEDYRTKWFKSCCHSCGVKCRKSDHRQPYHLLNYIRLSHLWLNGGIFSDFTFLFVGALDHSIPQQVWCYCYCSKVTYYIIVVIIIQELKNVFASACTHCIAIVN